MAFLLPFLSSGGGGLSPFLSSGGGGGPPLANATGIVESGAVTAQGIVERGAVTAQGIVERGAAIVERGAVNVERGAASVERGAVTGLQNGAIRLASHFVGMQEGAMRNVGMQTGAVRMTVGDNPIAVIGLVLISIFIVIQQPDKSGNMRFFLQFLIAAVKFCALLATLSFAAHYISKNSIMKEVIKNISKTDLSLVGNPGNPNKTDLSLVGNPGTGKSTIQKSTVYAIRSCSSDHYLDGRKPEYKQVYLTNRNPKGDAYLNWTFEEVDGNFAIKSVSSRKYLDGRNKDYAKRDGAVWVTDRNPKGDKYLQWKLEPVAGGNYAIKSVSSGLYLNGRNRDYGGNQIWLTRGNPKEDKHLQWSKTEI